MKKVLTIVVILAFAVMAMGQNGKSNGNFDDQARGQNNVDHGVGTATTGGDNVDQQGAGGSGQKSAPPNPTLLKGEKEDTGRDGQDGRDGGTKVIRQTTVVNHYPKADNAAHRMMAGYDYKAKGYIDQHIAAQIALNNISAALKGFLSPLLGRAAAGTPATTDPNQGQAAERPEENTMSGWVIAAWVFGTILAVALLYCFFHFVIVRIIQVMAQNKEHDLRMRGCLPNGNRQGCGPNGAASPVDVDIASVRTAMKFKDPESDYGSAGMFNRIYDGNGNVTGYAHENHNWGTPPTTGRTNPAAAAGGVVINNYAHQPPAPAAAAPGADQAAGD
ncbi:MAG TPA: hypothetical protein VLE93_00675 [Candidatus Saccharimonadales bacterium]|nr:hypothetical protein [Candidatus Saccharimonadales bacterium]